MLELRHAVEAGWASPSAAIIMSVWKLLLLLGVTSANNLSLGTIISEHWFIYQ